MTKRLLGLACSLAACSLAACSARAENAPTAHAEAAQRPAPTAPTAPTHHLGEWFPARDGRCRLLTAERLISERPSGEVGRVSIDVPVVAVRFECRVDEREVPAESALSDARYLDERGVSHAPLAPPKERSRADELYFEVAAHDDGLLTPRRYDPRSGEPVYQSGEARRARLLAPTARAVVALHRREHDRALDLFSDRLARTLAERAPFDTLTDSVAGRDAMDAAKLAYADALDRFGFHELVATAELEEERHALTLTLTKSSSGQHDLRLTFELAGAGEYRAVLGVRGLDEVRHAIACRDREAALHARLASEPSEESRCNVLGLSVPGGCSEQNPLVREALTLGSRCREHPMLQAQSAETGRKASQARAVSATDFSVTLRRGRPLASLEPAPEYSLSVDRTGRVLFASAAAPEPLEGRTSPKLVAALERVLARMRYFERLDGDHQRCKANDTRGDTLVVRAGGRELGVRDRDGCRGPFAHDELDAVENALEEITSVSTFLASLRHSPAPAPDVWVVALE